MVSVRPARASDVVRVTKYALPSFAGVVCEENGEVIGTGLVLVVRRRALLTMDITERLRQMPRVLIRISFNLVEAGVRAFGELYVMQDDREPGSGKWLDRLGFMPTGETMSGAKVWKRLRQ